MDIPSNLLDTNWLFSNVAGSSLQKYFGENQHFDWSNSGILKLDQFPDNHAFIIIDEGNSQWNHTSSWTGAGPSFSMALLVSANQKNITSISSSRFSVPPLHSQKAVLGTSIFGLKKVCANLGKNDHPDNILLCYVMAYIDE